MLGYIIQGSAELLIGARRHETRPNPIPATRQDPIPARYSRPDPIPATLADAGLDGGDIGPAERWQLADAPIPLVEGEHGVDDASVIAKLPTA